MTDRLNDPTLATETPSSADGSDRRARLLSEGDRLGRYTILRLLGRGGMGAVYEAEDPELGRRVAIKILHEGEPGTQGDREALRREAQALATLVHQNVVMVYDVGVDSAGDVFLVMQLVEGETINAWIARTKPSPEEVIAKFRLAGAGLQGAHDAGLVHCDFKPQNVLIDDEGAVRVGDFGLARRSAKITTGRSGGHNVPTKMTTLAGTPAYMAPEQFEGLVTKASDQFAFCVALWECLAGERPFEDSSVATLDPASRGERRELPSNARVPRYVRRVLERGMADAPAARFPSMGALLDALQPPRSTGPIIAAALGAAAITGVVMYFAMRTTPHVPELWGGADVDHATPLTSLGATGCAYAPTIDLGGTVVYDRTIGDNVDLYTVPLAGGESRQVTRAPDTWEWRAQPGRKPGEVVHLITDRIHPERSKVALLDLATGQQTELLTGLVWDATIANGTLYYSPQGSEGIWVKRGSIESAFAVPPKGQGYLHLGSSPTGDLLSVSNKWINGPRRACVIDVATTATRCLELDTVMRPAFSADGTAVYVPTSHGIVRHDLATGDETPITSEYTEGGIAIAPDGSALVYSTCKANVAIRDLATGKVLVADDAAGGLAVSKTGLFAWVRTKAESSVLVMLTLDGRQIELTRADQGNAGRPRFSPDGRYLVFGLSKQRPEHLPAGIFVVDLQRAGGLRRVTKGDDDLEPIFTQDNIIAFTRGTADGDDHVWTVRLDGTDLKQISESTRTAYGSRGTQILVGGVDNMLWYEPATGQETPGPPRPEGEIAYASSSPSGNWVVYSMGSEGEDVWRVATNGGALEHVRRFTADQYVLQPAIDDQGRIVLPMGPYAGDLVKIPARDGFAF